MMNQDHVPDPKRLRSRMPGRFSWIDQRALDCLQNCPSSHAHSLYLVLVLLSNRHGLSYYSDKSLCGRLRLNRMELRHGRRQLVDAGLIAYRRPYYQVVDLGPRSALPADPKPSPAPEMSSEEVHRELQALRKRIQALPNP